MNVRYPSLSDEKVDHCATEFLRIRFGENTANFLCFPLLPAYSFGGTILWGEAPEMPFVVFVTLAVTGWFYAAATYQNHGYAWADQTCESMQSFCAEPHKVGIVAIAVVTMFLILRAVKS